MFAQLCNLHRRRVFKHLVLVSVLLVAVDLSAAAKKKKPSTPAVGEVPLRELAGAELVPQSSSEEAPTPSIMLPLHDTYVPNKVRGWNWTIETRVITQRLVATRPPNTYGLADLSQFGSVPFAGLSAGIEKSFFGSYWGLSVTGEFTNKQSNYRAPTGYIVPVQIQYLGYGLEPHWSYVFNRWTGTTFSYLVQSITVNHSSTSPSMASWTQQYIEQGPRLAADFFLSQSEDGRNKISLAYDIRNSTFGQNNSWSLAYGATW